MDDQAFHGWQQHPMGINFHARIFLCMETYRVSKIFGKRRGANCSFFRHKDSVPALAAIKSQQAADDQFFPQHKKRGSLSRTSPFTWPVVSSLFFSNPARSWLELTATRASCGTWSTLTLLSHHHSYTLSPFWPFWRT